MRFLAAAVIVVLLALVAGAAWAVQSGSLAEAVRLRAVEELSRALGRDVRIDALSGDPWRGIVLRGVRIAGPAGSPRAFLQAPQVGLTFDVGVLMRDLLAGRGVLASLTRIRLERPFLVLARDAAGRWNYADLLAGGAGAGGASAFRALVEVHEGGLAFTDALRSSGRAGAAPPAPFAVRFDRITGTVDFGGAPALAILLDAVHTDGRTPALVRVSGRAVLGEGTFDLDLAARGGSVAVWGPYLVRLPWLVWGGGTFDSTMHLLASRWGRRVVLDYRGRLTMRDGRALVLPRRTLLSDIDGSLTVDNLGVSTTGITMALNASPLSARGRITIQGGVAMDLTLRSRTLDLRTLQATLFPRARLRLTGRARGEVRVTGTATSPRVEGRIERAAGAIDRQRFADLSGRFSYYGGVLSFDDLAAAAGGGRVRGLLQLNVRTGDAVMVADARGVDTRLLDGIGLTLSPTVTGDATGVVAAARTPDGVVAQGRVSLGPGAALGMAFDRAEGIFGLNRGRFELDRLGARSGGTMLRAHGAMSPSGALDVAVIGTDVDLSTVGALFGAGAWVAGTADLDGRLSGTLREPVLDAHLRGRDGAVGPLPFDLARGRFRLTRDAAQTPGVLLFDGDGRYFASGLVRWAGPPHLDLTLRAADVPAQHLLDVAEVPLRVGGTVETTVRLTGSPARPTAEGTVVLRGGHIEGQRLDRAAAAFQWNGSRLRIEQLTAGVNGSTLLAGGTVSRSGALGIAFSARALNLTDIAALERGGLSLSGAVDLTGTLRGTLKSPVLAADAVSESLVVNGQAFDRARGQVTYRGGRLALAPLVLQQNGGTYEMNGTLLLREDPQLSLRVDAVQGRVATLLGLARIHPPFALDGTLDGQVTAAGPLRDLRALLDLRLTDGRFGDAPIHEGYVRAELAGRAVTLETLRITPARGELVGAGRINLAGRSEVEFGGTGVDLDLLRPLFNLRRPLRGALDFTVQLTGELNDPLVGLSVAVTDGGVGAAEFDRLSLQAYYRAGQLNVEQGAIQEDRHRVEIVGTVPFNPARMRLDETRPVNLRLDLVNSDLGLLGLLSDRIEQAAGVLGGSVTVTGTPGQPHLEGRITASEGRLKLIGVEPALTDLQGAITFTEDRLRVDSLTARVGEGRLAAAGTVGIRRFRPDTADLTLTAEAARISLPGIYTGRVDGTLTLTGPLEASRIGGEVTLSTGDIYVSGAQGLAGRPADGRRGPGLDVDVRAGDGLWVNVGGLRLQVTGGVHATGTPSAPRLAGEIAAERGAFVAFNTTFRLLEGTATFTSFRGLVPFIDALAETRLSIPRVTSPRPANFERATVRLHVTGTPDALALDLTSDPPFSRAEILAALGRQSGFAALFTGGPDLEAALISELSNALFGQVGLAVASALGLEEFTLEYDAERQFALRIGTLLIRDLYLTWTTEFTIPRRTVWALEYRLSPTQRLSFSVDNFSRWNVLFRVTYQL